MSPPVEGSEVEVATIVCGEGMMRVCVERICGERVCGEGMFRR